MPKTVVFVSYMPTPDYDVKCECTLPRRQRKGKDVLEKLSRYDVIIFCSFSPSPSSSLRVCPCICIRACVRVCVRERAAALVKTIELVFAPRQYNVVFQFRFD